MRLFHAMCVIALLFAGCCTIMNGRHQSVQFKSKPSGATVEIDGHSLGRTPCYISLARSREHRITIVLDGFEPYNDVLYSNLSGWVLGNIFIGIIPGLIIDAVTGSMYVLHPNEIDADLIANRAWKTDPGGFSIMVSLEPIEDRQPITSLIPITD